MQGKAAWIGNNVGMGKVEIEQQKVHIRPAVKLFLIYILLQCLFYLLVNWRAVCKLMLFSAQASLKTQKNT